jgi:hypothetical protein
MDAVRQALAARIVELERALRAAARNDKSRYDHHEPRPFDGMRPMDESMPPEQRGSIWLTPREIARRALREPDLATFEESFKAVRLP